jgi:hypothetical protein
MATQGDEQRRRSPSARCSLCGTALPVGVMVADGGQACADIRWYCQDAQSCTERWTAKLPTTSEVALAASSGATVTPAGAGEPMSGEVRDPVPAHLLGAPEEA